MRSNTNKTKNHSRTKCGPIRSRGRGMNQVKSSQDKIIFQFGGHDSYFQFYCGCLAQISMTFDSLTSQTRT